MKNERELWKGKKAEEQAARERELEQMLANKAMIDGFFPTTRQGEIDWDRFDRTDFDRRVKEETKRGAAAWQANVERWQRIVEGKEPVEKPSRLASAHYELSSDHHLHRRYELAASHALKALEIYDRCDAFSSKGERDQFLAYLARLEYDAAHPDRTIREDERVRQIKQQRQSNGLCMMCGRELGLFDRVRRRTTHHECLIFIG